MLPDITVRATRRIGAKPGMPAYFLISLCFVEDLFHSCIEALFFLFVFLDTLLVSQRQDLKTWEGLGRELFDEGRDTFGGDSVPVETDFGHLPTRPVCTEHPAQLPHVSITHPAPSQVEAFQICHLPPRHPHRTCCEGGKCLNRNPPPAQIEIPDGRGESILTFRDRVDHAVDTLALIPNTGGDDPDTTTGQPAEKGILGSGGCEMEEELSVPDLVGKFRDVVIIETEGQTVAHRRLFPRQAL
mmetsp:Transcript_13534/g.26843  ORF Transcript_13534/g.26843 Transcript_13534/m.26843 type:complete len:243 (-) Transcript_13534:1479-2207(-)